MIVNHCSCNACGTIDVEVPTQYKDMKTNKNITKILVTAILVLTVTTLVSCGEGPQKSMRDFIPGTYVKYDEGPLSQSWDTLRISEYDAAANTFEIQRTTGFQRIEEGRLQPHEYEAIRMMTLYDALTGQLQDIKKRKTFVFSIEKKTVNVGNAEYHKVQ